MMCKNQACCKHGRCIKDGHLPEVVTGPGVSTRCRNCGEVNIPMDRDQSSFTKTSLPEEFKGEREAPWNG